MAILRSLQLLVASLALSGSALGHEKQDEVRNANHIFNAIHSSMRQWGSSLNHNGMTFWLATVPEGTQFYHGTSTSKPIVGYEWLAFEPEHAMGFARPKRGGPPGGGPGGGGPGKGPGDSNDGPPGDPAGGLAHQDNVDHERLLHTTTVSKDRDSEQQPLKHGREDGEMPESSTAEDEYGYLHTYTTNKDLRLVYMDGMSAGKSEIGTLDAGDRILYNDSIQNGENDGSGHGPPGEGTRAVIGCQMADEDWNGRIDGFIRMEAGFEIILCHFERDLEVERITQAKSSSRGGPKRRSLEKVDKGHDKDDRGGPPASGGRGKGGPGGPGGGGGANSWMTAITARYQGIGGHRVLLNYDNFVSAYTYDLDLFSEDPDHPRLTQFSSSQLDPIRADLNELVMSYEPPAPSSFDWQSITSMIVIRYSDELENFIKENSTSLDVLHQRAERLLQMFVDYSDSHDTEAIVERCTNQFIPRRAPRQTVAGQSVVAVSKAICSQLTEALYTKDADETYAGFERLVSYLKWSTWKDCRGCETDEVCLIPVWPWGTVEDYKHPHCQKTDGSSGKGGESYWGGFGPR